MKIGMTPAVIGLAFLLLFAPTAGAEKIVGLGGMCLDIKGGAGKGNPIVIWPCNGQLSQTWHTDIQLDEIRSAEGYCLDVRGGGGKGSSVIAWPCHNRKNQQWDIMRDGTIRTQDGLCLDVRGDSASKGTPVIVWPCKKSNNKNQKWKFRQ